jgi:hypothetical protein
MTLRAMTAEAHAASHQHDWRTARHWTEHAAQSHLLAEHAIDTEGLGSPPLVIHRHQHDHIPPLVRAQLVIAARQDPEHCAGCGRHIGSWYLGFPFPLCCWCLDATRPPFARWLGAQTRCVDRWVGCDRAGCAA